MITKDTVKIDIDSVIIKKQLRNSLGNISLLVASIQKYGLFSPIIISRENVLIAGSRRLAACREAGLTSVSAIKYDISCNSIEALDIQSDENLCREKLSSEEFDRHISNKKSTLIPGPYRTLRNAWNKFKVIFQTRKQ